MKSFNFDPVDFSAVVTMQLCFSVVYSALAWLICGGDSWWIVDFIHGMNVFYGDDAYRFFLAKLAWTDPSLYSYNFDLPVALALEGLVVVLPGVEVFEARVVHALIASLSLCFIWSAGLTLGFGRRVMVCTVLLMGFMPLYALVSLSFYGEAWLSLFICASIWLFSKERWTGLAITSGLLPLIRPEGIFFLMPILAFFIHRRLLKEAFLLLVPGGVYFLYLCISLDRFGDYMLWRTELRRILIKLPYDEDRWKLFFLVTPFISLPALLGLGNKRIWKIWPLVLGAAIWAVFLQLEIILGLAYFETRYGYILIPVVALLWAGGVSILVKHISSFYEAALLRRFVPLFFLIIGFFGSLYQMDGFRLTIKKEGLSGFLEIIYQGRWGEVFPRYESGYMENYRAVGERLHGLLDKDEGIKKVIIFDSFLYYFIDNDKIPDGVRVEYPALGYLIFHVMLNGQIFTQHHGEKMYSYYTLGEPDFSEGEKRLIYVDAFPMPKYPYRWENEGVQMYIFSYLESSKPDADLDAVPRIDHNEINRLYKQTFLWK